MSLTKIQFQNFRIFTSEVFSFGETTVIVGHNGVGKTSITEAIALLSTGNSFRASKVEEMVALGVELGRVKGKVTSSVSPLGKKILDPDDEDLSKDEDVLLEVILTRGEVQGKRTQKRLYSVNDVRRRKKDFLGNFYTVVFRPEDLRLIEGSPYRRRSFVDTVLGSVDVEYAVALHTYEQTLKRRNKLLHQIREKEQPRSTLSYWNMLMIKHGEVVQEKRHSFFQYLQKIAFPFVFNVVYKPSLISEERAAEYLDKEIIVGHSLIGPHKDDFMVSFMVEKSEDPVDLSAYGSRGQQRLGVLWLKLGELAFIKEKTAQKPVLLLDDIMSELDEQSRDMVLGLIGKQQTIFTTANESVVDEVQKKDKNFIKINL